MPKMWSCAWKLSQKFKIPYLMQASHRGLYMNDNISSKPVTVCVMLDESPYQWKLDVHVHFQGHRRKPVSSKNTSLENVWIININTINVAITMHHHQHGHHHHHHHCQILNLTALLYHWHWQFAADIPTISSSKSSNLQGPKTGGLAENHRRIINHSYNAQCQPK